MTQTKLLALYKSLRLEVIEINPDGSRGLWVGNCTLTRALYEMSRISAKGQRAILFRSERRDEFRREIVKSDMNEENTQRDTKFYTKSFFYNETIKELYS